MEAKTRTLQSWCATRSTSSITEHPLLASMPLHSKIRMQHRCPFLALGRKWIRGRGVSQLLRRSLALRPRTPIRTRLRVKTSTRWVIKLRQLLTWWISTIAKMFSMIWTRAKEAPRGSITTALWKDNNSRMRVSLAKATTLGTIKPIRIHWSPNNSWAITRALMTRHREAQMAAPEVSKLVLPIQAKHLATPIIKVVQFTRIKVRKHHFRILSINNKLLSQALFDLHLPCVISNSNTIIWRTKTIKLRTLRLRVLQLINVM